MRAFKIFFFGLLYGWFFKIAFDRIYHQNDMDDMSNENRSLREYIESLEGQLESRALQGRAMQRMDYQPQPQPQAAPVPEETEIPVPPDTLGATEEIKDDLQIIKGIGPAIERRLNNAGIFTFAALSRLTANELENILGSQVKRLQDENDLLAQARELAQGRDA